MSEEKKGIPSESPDMGESEEKKEIPSEAPDTGSGMAETPADKKNPKMSKTTKTWVAAGAIIALVVTGNIVQHNLRLGEGSETVTSSSAPSGGSGGQSSSPARNVGFIAENKPETLENELLQVGMRYKPSGSEDHVEQWDVVTKDTYAEDPGDDWKFSAGVIEAAQTLTESESKGTSTLESAKELAESAAGDDAEKREFADLLGKLNSRGTYVEDDYDDDAPDDVDSVYVNEFISGTDSGSGATVKDATGISADSSTPSSRISHPQGAWDSPQDMLKSAGQEGSFSAGDSSGGFLDSIFGSNSSSSSSSSSSTSSSTQSTSDGDSYEDSYGYAPTAESETYAPVNEPGFLPVSTNPVSTVSADIDTASYANFRRQVNEGDTASMIYDDSIRVEEWLNYFDYDYENPDEGELFGITQSLGKCPWNDDTQLLTLGFSTDADAAKPKGGRNIVFLIDVSGSMDEEDKLPLLQKAMGDLVDRLGEDDTVSLVTYANEGRIVLNGAKGSEPSRIKSAISSLVASGATNGGDGLRWAYEAAKKNFVSDGVNRIILCSDGDMNLGMSTTGELQDYVDERRNEGIYLSVLGFGTGNYHDQNMEAIADHGNGAYHYIDCLAEANKVLDKELNATMNPLADDVKIQVEFNPANVKSYRLIGYVDRTLAAGDFKDDSKDGGEVGAGQAFTVAYEIIPVESKSEDAPEIELRYGDKDDGDKTQDGVELVAAEVPEGLKNLKCKIGGEEYEAFTPGTLSYDVPFDEGVAFPAAPEMSGMGEGWSIKSSKSTKSPDGNDSITNNVTLTNGDQTRQYVFKYVRK